MNLNAARSWVVQEFVAALESVVQAITSIRPQVLSRPLDDPTSAAAQRDSIWWAQAFTGLPSPSFWLGATLTTVNALSQSVLSARGTEGASPDDARSACQEVFARIANTLARSLSRCFATPVMAEGVTAADAPQGTLAAILVVELPGVPDAAVLTVRCDNDFLSRLDQVLAPTYAHVSPTGRIADIELSVHATLGRTIVPLRDVFKLTVGSVIDIGTSVIDPVDLVVNDRLIARGQVVNCNGSYGVKLTHQFTGSGDDSCRTAN